MPGTYPVLLLKIDGNVELSQIKQAAAKPSLKDLQTHLKKKVLPSVITTYPYGPKRVTAIGYTKGKEDELSQHQLPPPCEINEVYGTIVLVVHPSKVTWDSSTSSVELFTPSNYEEFYEKACSGDLIEEGDDDAEAEVEDGDEIVEEEAEGDEAEDEEGEGEEAEGEVEEADLLEDEIEEAPRPVQRRKIIKIDPQQLQFQFKSNLVPEGECTPESAANLLKVKERAHILEVLSKLLSQHCDKDDLNELERGIYNASLNEAKTRQIPLTWEHETFRWIHQMIAKRAISNFNPDSYVGNTHLIQRWKNGEFTLDQLGGWTPYELKPMHWKDLKDQLLKREQRILEGNMSMATDRFRCSQCKEKKCSYYELQTRSADEPMTIFVKCLNCGKQWKQ
jgi:hypothetical protein